MIRNVGYYFDRYSTQVDAILFGTICLIGLFTQLILRYALDVPAKFVTLILIVLMSIYAYLIRFNSASKTGADRSGDTLYFLGFIFTTITLGIALIKVGESSREFATSVILSDLGIGIGTTIYGLTLRVLFSLSRTGTEEIEDKTLSNLNQKSKSLSTKLTRATQIAEETTLKVQQTLEETEKALVILTGGINTKFAKIYDDTVSNHQNILEKNTLALQNLFNKIDSIEVPTNLVEKTISKSFDDLRKSLIEFQSRIDDIKIDDAIIEKKVEIAISPLSINIQRISESISMLQENIRMLSVMDTSNISNTAVVFRELQIEVAKFKESLADQSFNPEVFNTFIEKAGERYISAVNELSDKLSAVVMPDNHLLEIIDNAFSHYHSFIKDTSEAIEKQSAELKSEMGDLKDSLNILKVQVSETAEAIRKSRSTGTIFDVFRR